MKNIHWKKYLTEERTIVYRVSAICALCGFEEELEHSFSQEEFDQLLSILGTDVYLGNELPFLSEEDQELLGRDLCDLCQSDLDKYRNL